MLGVTNVLSMAAVICQHLSLCVLTLVLCSKLTHQFTTRNNGIQMQCLNVKAPSDSQACVIVFLCGWTTHKKHLNTFVRWYFHFTFYKKILISWYYLKIGMAFSTIDRDQAGIPVSLVSADFLDQQEYMLMLACMSVRSVNASRGVWVGGMLLQNILMLAVNSWLMLE